ncbi:MAG: hypothetical protein ACOH2V_02615 [Candidatus Saccharimonadaceae bacterium]
MKKNLFLAVALLVTMSMSLSAQNNNKRNTNNRRTEQVVKVSAKDRADMMATKLELTSEQAIKVEALMEKQDAERKEKVAEHRKQRDTKSQDREKLREEMRASRLIEVEQQNAELEKIIGKEKVAKWNELRKEMRDSNRAGRRK